MIVVAAPALSAGQAAQRLAPWGGAVWAHAPRQGHQDGVVSWLAAEPVEICEHGDVNALEQAWQRARALWCTEESAIPVAFGFLSYDLGKGFVGGRHGSQLQSEWPKLEFRFYDAVLEVTPSAAAARIVATDTAAAARLLIRLAGPAIAADLSELCGPLQALEPESAFLAGVGKVRDYLCAGDAYQVNLARRLVAPLRPAGLAKGLSLSLALAQQASAPFAFWMGPCLNGPDRALVGNSPERFLHLEAGGRLITSPIKGTRARNSAFSAPLDPAVVELAHSPKDRAEHDMIVDLERNDLGRVCEVGSIEVVCHAEVMHLPTVHHLVSTVQGRLPAQGVSLAGLLEATFPGGSITGAPKRRAMEIISELEAAERGPYTGATGWLGAAGDLDLAVAIRTAALWNDTLTLWVGGGIVVDSQAEEELAETTAKAQAFARLWSGTQLKP